MAEYIEREAFIADKRKQYCADCDRRKGMKNEKLKFLYDIGDAPCRACGIDDMLSEVEDYPAADVRPVKKGTWIFKQHKMMGKTPCCSKCGKFEPMTRNFCPNCGAEMEGTE